MFTAAFLSDTHIDDHPTEHDLHLSATFADMAQWGPDVVLHGGDLTEYGSRAVLERYLSLLPEGLRDRIHHVAGNHETRWSSDGLTAYSALLARGPRSFDAGGLHFVLLEAAVVLQEQAYLGVHQLDWLKQDLAGTDAPTVIMLHFPMGGDFHFVNDADDFFATIADFPVRLLLSGHVHRQTVASMNGVVRLTSPATKERPGYYRLRRSCTDGRDELVIDRVDLRHPGPGDAGLSPRVRQVIRIDLSTPRCASPLRSGPSSRIEGDTVTVEARLRPTDLQIEAAAEVWQEGTYAATSPGAWTPLHRTNETIAGEMDVSDLPPGHYRLRLRAQSDMYHSWEFSSRIQVPDGAVQPMSTFSLDGPVQGGLVSTAGVTVATTTTGHTYGLSVHDGTLAQQWLAHTGSVYRTPAVSTDGDTLYVPSVDGHLHALRASDGSFLWSAYLGHAVLSSPSVAEVDGEQRVFVTAGNRMICLARDGSPVWESTIAMQSCGSAAVTADLVIIGAGDGSVRALDAATGEQRWVFDTNDHPFAYRRLIYGPWSTNVTVIDHQTVVASTVTHLYALDVDTGQERWSLPGTCLYTPVLPLGDRVLRITQQGEGALIDTTTGTSTTLGSVVPISLDAAPVHHGDRVYHVGFSGLLASIDLATARSRTLRQVTTARVMATPLLLDSGSTLLVAGQDGIVHALNVDQV